MAQVHEVIGLLVKAANENQIPLSAERFEIVKISNSVGDVDLKNELYKMQGMGVFCK